MVSRSRNTLGMLVLFTSVDIYYNVLFIHLEVRAIFNHVNAFFGKQPSVHVALSNGIYTPMAVKVRSKQIGE